MLIFETDWFLLGFLIFGRELRYLFLYFELLSTQPKPFLSARLFHRYQVQIVDQCLIPQDLDHFEHYC